MRNDNLWLAKIFQTKEGDETSQVGLSFKFAGLAYLIGQNFGGQNFRKSDLLPKILSAEKFGPPKILSAEIFCPLKS